MADTPFDDWGYEGGPLVYGTQVYTPQAGGTMNAATGGLEWMSFATWLNNTALQWRKELASGNGDAKRNNLGVDGKPYVVQQASAGWLMPALLLGGAALLILAIKR